MPLITAVSVAMMSVSLIAFHAPNEPSAAERLERPSENPRSMIATTGRTMNNPR